MVSGKLSFGEFLRLLIQRGEHARALRYKAVVSAAFNGVLSEREVLALPFSEVLSFFLTFNSVVAGGMSMQRSLRQRVRGLQQQGYCVLRGKLCFG